jgi:hypothetical protein
MILSIIPLWLFWLAQWTYGRIKNGAPKRYDDLAPLPIEVPLATSVAPRDHFVPRGSDLVPTARSAARDALDS